MEVDLEYQGYEETEVYAAPKENEYVQPKMISKHTPLPNIPREAHSSTYKKNVSAADNSTYPRKNERCARAKWLFVFLTGAVIVVMLIALIIQVFQSPSATRITTPTNAPNIGGTIIPKSCLEIKQSGQNTDGLYTIKPADNAEPSEVYCDMTTDGGGWTLVASVHENDIKRKCDSDDLWSLYATRARTNMIGKTMWENDLNFGTTRKANKGDFKSNGYHLINASNVMVWHVPHNVPVTSYKSLAKLRYRTDNNFLVGYGGNLRNLYVNYFPFTLETAAEYQEAQEKTIDAVLNAVGNKAQAIRNIFPEWYNYTTPSTSTILDTKLFSTYGNRITSSYPGCYSTHYYGRIYACGTAISKSSATHPFLFASIIKNHPKTIAYYEIRVESYKSTAQVVTEFSNEVTLGSIKLQYHVIQYSSSVNPVECRFFFAASDVQNWNSMEPTRSLQLYNTTSYYRSYFRASQYPVNVIIGYMLLLRNGAAITQNEAAKVAQEVIEAMATVPASLFDIGSGLSVPVVFDFGNQNDVTKMIPPSFRQSVEPGFIQFRGYGTNGFPNALCPGVKLTRPISPYVCVGGISDNVNANGGFCGDFAGWEGSASDVPQVTTATGTAHSLQDILTTIFVFYR